LLPLEAYQALAVALAQHLGEPQKHQVEPLVRLMEPPFHGDLHHDDIIKGGQKPKISQGPITLLNTPIVGRWEQRLGFFFSFSRIDAR